MATAFDGLGMSRLGADRTRGTGPLSELAQMIPAGLLGYSLYKSGAVENLNDMFNPKKILGDKVKNALVPAEKVPPEAPAAPVVPPQNAAAMIPPAPDVSVPSSPPQRSIDDDVNDVIPIQSSSLPINTSVAQNTLTPRDTSQDMAQLQLASQPAVPPGGRDMQPVGQQGKGGGGVMKAVLPELMKLFFA
jgi:hypothetical protein